MNILIIGNGGREHALAWKAKQSLNVAQVFVAPGNAGTALEPSIQNIDISPTDIPSLVHFAKHHQIALTIVGPEAPLVAGIVDVFHENNLSCFGPTKAAARLESSKAFSKDFMKQYQIPTAEYRTFTDVNAAKSYIKQQIYPLVIKADGLAGGKGVVIVENETQAIKTIEHLLTPDSITGTTKPIVIEEFLQGEEASFMVMSDGQFALALATSQDHKTRDEGDLGPNTGGMGAYSPAPIVTPDIHDYVMNHVIYPTLKGMREMGTPYVGFLYPGLMITKSGVKVLEFNCRLGDPETQPILLRLKSDLVQACLATLDKRLDTVSLEWDPRPAVGVVMASAGYPYDYPKGDIIEGLPGTETPHSKVFHAGTVLQNGDIKTAGGRVLCATALGQSVRDAQLKAYELVNAIHWKHQYYRKDIGHRAIARELDDYGH